MEFSSGDRGARYEAGSNEETVTVSPAGTGIEGMTKGGLTLAVDRLNSSPRLTSGVTSRLLAEDEACWLVDESKKPIGFFSFIFLTSSFPLAGPFKNSAVSSSKLLIRKSFFTWARPGTVRILSCAR